MHEVLVNRLGGLSLPRKSVVRLTDRPDMTLDVYRGRKTTMQMQHVTSLTLCFLIEVMFILKAIKSHIKGSYDNQNLTLVVISYEIHGTCQRLIS